MIDKEDQKGIPARYNMPAGSNIPAGYNSKFMAPDVDGKAQMIVINKEDQILPAFRIMTREGRRMQMKTMSIWQIPKTRSLYQDNDVTIISEKDDNVDTEISQKVTPVRSRLFRQSREAVELMLTLPSSIRRQHSSPMSLHLCPRSPKRLGKEKA